MKSAEKTQWLVPSRVTTGLLQRKCACGGQSGLAGECKDCQEEKSKLQRSARGPARGAAPDIVHEVLNSSGEPLEKSTRAAMETRFGHDFSNVRVHTDARAAESADAVNAFAYTVRNDIVFASGKYSPATDSGSQLIAHELTHVVQQSRSGPSSAGNLVLDEPHSQMELQAEQAASTASQEHSVKAAAANHTASVQRQQAPPPAPKAPAKAPAKKTSKAAEKKTYPVENCPLPSDFPDEHEAGMNMMCVAPASFEKNSQCNLTAKHLELLNKAKEPALKRVEKAEARMHWLGGPEYAERVGRRIFKGEPPDKATIQQTLTKLVKILGGTSLQFRGATCADPLCESVEERQHAVAYESGPTEPVAICERSFLPGYLPKLARTVIHEAVHLAGIDIDPNIKERYCDGKGCEDKCDDTTNAEAWTLFIDCLGGPLIKPKTE